MRPHHSAKRAAEQAARQAHGLLKAVVGGPAGVDAGFGVSVEQLRQALPLYRWKELTTFANFFGQRGRVVREVSAELAGEIGRRLSTRDVAAAAAANAATAAGRPAKAVAALPGARPQEVAAIAYSFSKLREQLPEYMPVYDAVAEGIRHGAWDFNRLQAALVGAALADAQVHLSEALPAVVRTLLGQMAADEQVREAITLDELRYLTHACAHIEGPGLSAEEVELIADAALRHAESSDAFSNLAHLAISLLRLPTPAAAKGKHQKALRAVCVRLQGLKPSRSAHPLPSGGMASVVAGFLAQERRAAEPPLTPPIFGDIMVALMLISRAAVGAGRVSPEKALGRSFSFDDWMDLAPIVLDFCQAHSTTAARTAAEEDVPLWATRMLGHIVVGGRLQERPVQLSSLRRLLQLLRRYRSNPAPDARFYEWASEQVIAHGARGFRDRDLLAKLVGELVPKLPDAARTRLAKVMLADSQEAKAPAAELADSLRTGAAYTRLLYSAAAAAQPWGAAQVRLADRGASEPAAARPAARTEELWGLLGAATAAPSSAPAVASAAVARQEAAEAVAAPAVAAAVAAEPLAAQQAAEAAPAQRPDVERLTSTLELALERIATLEARLERSPATPQERVAEEPTLRAQSQEREVPAKREAASRHAEDCEVHEATSRWPVAAALGGLAPAVTAATGGPAHLAMLNLRQPFSFEQFRRAESPKLQAQRLRVIMPPDHIPCFMFPKK